MKCKSLKYSIISTAVVTVLSLAAWCMGFALTKSGHRASAYFFGCATGLTAVAAAQFIRTLVMMKNPKYRKQQESTQKDERIISIRNRAMAVSYYVTTLAVAAASVIFALKGNMENARNFSTVICFSTLVFLIAYLILSNKE